ncbi:hypothetical protein BU16DRAFT_526363 [Lophium mytilinum]|uniref:2EXR domain-containing protein n=1 Tax=Lophium mytilinum TaxID=390894 RepID=A0A6A6QUF0_9PEZI|nr:hypothetical protein BU16DRAFT_526363 [Lophium mytilinum]
MARTRKPMTKKKMGLPVISKYKTRATRTSKSAQATKPAAKTKKLDATKKRKARAAATSKSAKATKAASKTKKLDATKNRKTRAAKTSKSAQASKPAGTGFLSLSGELRNMIYEQVLIFSEKILVGYGNNKKPRKQRVRGAPRPPTGVPALLQVCRQIRQEGLSIFYSANTFALHEDNDVIRRDPGFELKFSGSKWYVTGRPATGRFERWCASLGDSLRWLRSIHLCYRFRKTGYSGYWTVRYSGDFFQWVKFAVQHPDVAITIASEDTYCGCVEGKGPASHLTTLADKIPILDEPAWVEGIRAGNITSFVGLTARKTHDFGNWEESWEVRVIEVAYRSQAQEEMDEDDWQDICDDLSLGYEFEVQRKSARGKGQYGMIVEAKPEVIVIDD